MILTSQTLFLRTQLLKVVFFKTAYFLKVILIILVYGDVIL